MVFTAYKGAPTSSVSQMLGMQQPWQYGSDAVCLSQHRFYKVEGCLQQDHPPVDSSESSVPLPLVILTDWLQIKDPHHFLVFYN